MRDLVVITARGNSKGVPGKNIRLLGGRPLVYYTLDAACEIADAESICVSTDSEEIAEAVRRYGLGVPFRRPEELATDSASSQDVVLHAIQFYEDHGREFDRVILLQPTSPFRTGEHVRHATALYTPDIDMVASVRESRANPYYSLFEEGTNGFMALTIESLISRRQDCPIVYEMTGAIFVINTISLRAERLEAFKRVRKYVMSEEDSVDIDTPFDWLVAEAVLRDRELRNVT